MGSVAIVTVELFASLLFAAWLTAAAARRVGSTRGRLAVALALVVALQAIYLLANGVAAAIAPRLPGGPMLARLSIGLAAICFLFGAAIAVFGVGFKLSFRRALAPLAAFFVAQIVVAAFAYGVVRPWCIESFYEVASMSPTILPTDRFMADKLLSPRRGDVIVYRVAARSFGQPATRYCKRLLGLPGERLCIEHGGLTVDGRAITLPAPIAGHLRAAPGPAGMISPRHPEGATFTLGANEYFVVGDDVDRSADSRIDPPVHRDAIIGVVDAIYWPPARMRTLR